MSFNGLAASFLPFTINGLTDATFSNSNIGNAIATTLQLTSATPLKLARFNADRELVSASVDESQVALLVGNNVFNGSQTILPGTSTNINNVIKTAITAEAYNEASFTTSGISGYTAPLGTLSGPTAGEYSIGQTANDRTIMKINGFVPTEKTWVYSFVIRIVDAAEGYLSVEQSGVQRSSTLRLITSELTTVSDTFTYNPTSGPIVFKIYTGSLDPWNASWSSFTLGSYTAAITAPLSAPLVATAISTTTIGTEILAFPLVSSVNSEAWSVYAISTMGDPSSLGGLIFQEATLGVGAYITGGVVGAKSFRFNTLSGNAGKVVVTNGNQVMSTSISAGQLQYITGLTSQAANSITTGTDKITQQYNATTGAGDVSTLINRGTLDAALALVPNLLPLANTWTGSYNQFNGTVSTMGTNKFIQPYNALVTDVSTCVNRAVLDASIAGLGAGILNLNNDWTGTNAFYSTLTTAVGQTTSINGALTTSLDDLGFTSASFTTAGITGAYTPPLGTITNPSGSTYQITQTAQARSIMAISGFTPSVGITYVFQFNINCTIGTATISVEQNNILRSPALYQLTTGFNKVVGSFTYDGTPNTVVFKIYTGIASWNAQWNSFVLSTYSIGMGATMNALTVNNRFTQRYNALVTDVSTLVNRATLDASVLAPFSSVSVGSVPYESATNTFSNSLMTQGTASLGYSGASFTASTGIASITFSSPTYTANSNASVQGIITLPALPSSVIGLPCIATFTALTFPLFATAPYPYFTLTNNGTVVFTSAVGASGTIVMPFTPTSTTLFITIFFKSPPTGVSVPVLTWTNFTITTPSMITTGFNTITGRETVGQLVVNGTASITGATTITADTTSNGFILNGGGSYVAGSIFSDANWGMLFRARIAGTAAAFSWHNSTGTERLRMTDAGVMSHTSGDSSYMKYGPNATWSSYLVVGATPNRVASADTAQVITTNGNLHLDAGNSRDMYYGYYANSNGTPNTHQFYGTSVNFPSGLPQNGTSFSQVAVFDGNTLKRSQAANRLVYFNNNVAWGGGVNMVNAFYLYNTACSVQFWGKNSGYYSGAGMMQTTIRVYSQSSGAYYYFPINAFVNNGYNHFTVPLNYSSTFPYTGWYDIYVYSTSGWITDGNDQLTIGVTVLPASGF